MGAIGATGTLAANRLANSADLVIGIGTRYSDFTTASKTAFQHPDVRFININVAEFDSGLPHVPVFIGEFNQVILNLLVNAAHAIAEASIGNGQHKGIITVSTRREGDWAEVRVCDNGAGIPEKVRHRIFEPFFTTKQIGKGTGQGLTIAHSVIVKKHSGDLRFETETGKGTCFIIRLPLEQTGKKHRDGIN